MVFNTEPYTVLPDSSILIIANMQSETGFPSSRQLKSYFASKSRLNLAARAVLSADAGLLVLYRETYLPSNRAVVPCATAHGFLVTFLNNANGIIIIIIMGPSTSF